MTHKSMKWSIFLSINRGMDKEDMGGCVCVYIYTYTYSGIVLAAIWMDLETVISSEVIQAQKGKYHMISLICGI